MPNRFAEHWSLDPSVEFLNHGAFGACPRKVLLAQNALRARLEAEPVRFMLHELEPLLDAARASVATFVGARPENLAFVTNTTAGVNTLLASLALKPGDELLLTNHSYPACTNAAEFWAARAGARVVVTEIPMPVRDGGSVTERVLAALTPKTRLVLLDHVTSATALVFPVEEMARELRARGVEFLVDGAHAPGMLPLEIEAIGADYYVGNLHKWCCAPKGAALLWVRPERQPGVRPLVISHGSSSRRSDRSRFWLEFDWLGTDDPTAVLAVPEALRLLGSLLPGGWDELRCHNRELCVAARKVLLEAVPGEPLCPESMLGSMATLCLPDSPTKTSDPKQPFAEPLYGSLNARGFQVLCLFWPAAPRQIVRITCQVYNELSQYERLAVALGECLS